MLLGLFSDIHANREALDACLAHAARAGVCRYAFLGDIVGYGADPTYAVEVVMRYAEQGAIVLRGNHDEAVAGSLNGFNASAAATILWTRDRLGSAEASYIAELPLVHEEDDILLVHANAWAPGAWGYVTTALEAERSMRRTTARVTVCGHTHVPRLFHLPHGRPASRFTPFPGVPIPLTIGRRWLAVLGAVGQPRDGNPAASYGVLDRERGTLTYVRVPYDAETAARKIIAAGLPPILGRRLLKGE